MRTVTPSLGIVWAMLIGAVANTAQAPAPRPTVTVSQIAASDSPSSARSPAAVTKRLKSFDVNADDRISRDELPERMQGLVARVDKNADAALDADEIRAFVSAASLERIRVAFRPPSAGGLPGVVNDLKLPPAKHQRALAIVGVDPGPRNINDPANSALLGEMKALLDDQEFENFVAAATRLSKSADIRFRTIGGVAGSVLNTAPPK